MAVQHSDEFERLIDALKVAVAARGFADLDAVRDAASAGIADPAAVQGDEATRLEAFREARDELWARVADLSRDLERTQFVSSRKR